MNIMLENTTKFFQELIYFSNISIITIKFYLHSFVRTQIRYSWINNMIKWKEITNYGIIKWRNTNNNYILCNHLKWNYIKIKLYLKFDLEWSINWKISSYWSRAKYYSWYFNTVDDVLKVKWFTNKNNFKPDIYHVRKEWKDQCKHSYS